jgi:hypothetical protein
MILRKRCFRFLVFLLAGIMTISFWVCSFPVFSDQNKEAASSSRRQIIISNLIILAVDSDECEVDLTVLATYKDFKSGPEPKLWYRLICGKGSSSGTIYLLSIQPNQSRINVNKKLKLAPMSRCSGKCNVLFRMEDGDVKSNELTGTCEFKR